MNGLKRFAKQQKVDFKQIEPLLKSVIDYQSETEYLAGLDEYDKTYFGSLWEKWDEIEDGVVTAVLINDLLLNISGNFALTKNARHALSEKLSDGMKSFLALYGDKLQQIDQTYRTLKELDEDIMNRFEIEWKGCDDNLSDCLLLTQRWIDHIDMLKDWSNWNRIKVKAVDAGLEEFTDFISGHENLPVKSLFLKSVYKLIIQNTIDASPELSQFSGKLFEDRIAKFRQLTKDFEELMRKELYAMLASRIPSFVREASQSSEVGILQRAINNKGRGISIRRLFDSIPSLLPRLTPCMLMSPISVAQYLDAGNNKFDLVIFDEASQVPTCDAVGAIARGKQVIVVGDPNQMPPTSFFSTQSVDEENMDMEDLDSILEDCIALSIPSSRLLCHYRSRHESLIAFSNSQFYENRLLTFPSPDNIESNVTYPWLDGFYD